MNGLLVHLELGEVRLAPEEFSDLRERDVVLLDVESWPAASGVGHLRVHGTSLRYLVSWERQEARLKAVIETEASPSSNDPTRFWVRVAAAPWILSLPRPGECITLTEGDAALMRGDELAADVTLVTIGDEVGARIDRLPAAR